MPSADPYVHEKCFQLHSVNFSLFRHNCMKYALMKLIRFFAASLTHV